MTLLTETLEIMKRNKVSDVQWVGSADGQYSISFEEFTRIADIEYDDGFGGQEIADDLIVVGTDWLLERHEYDGSEWWEFKQLPRQIPEQTGEIKTFKIVGKGNSDSIKGLNENR